MSVQHKSNQGGILQSTFLFYMVFFFFMKILIKIVYLTSPTFYHQRTSLEDIITGHQQRTSLDDITIEDISRGHHQRTSAANNVCTQLQNLLLDSCCIKFQSCFSVFFTCTMKVNIRWIKKLKIETQSNENTIVQYLKNLHRRHFMLRGLIGDIWGELNTIKYPW